MTLSRLRLRAKVRRLWERHSMAATATAAGAIIALPSVRAE